MHIYTRVQNRQGNVQKQTFIRFEASTKRFLIERFPRAHTLPSCNAWEMKENALNETGNFLFSSPFRLLLLLLWNSFHTLRYPADTKLLSSLNLFCACFVSWRSSVSRLHTFIIFIFPLFGVRNTYTAFAFLMWRFLKFFFLYLQQHAAPHHYHKQNFNDRFVFVLLRETDCSLQDDLKVLKVNTGTIKTIYSYATYWAIQPDTDPIQAQNIRTANEFHCRH